MRVAAMTANTSVSAETRKEMAAEMVALEEKRLGLDTPFMVRSFRYLSNCAAVKTWSRFAHGQRQRLA